MAPVQFCDFWQVPSSTIFHNHDIISLSLMKMSGGVGPPRDIALEQQEPHISDASADAAAKPAAKTPARRGSSFFTFKHLNALAVVIVLAASGMVCLYDFAFVVFSVLYLYFISKVAFPPTFTHPATPEYNNKSKLLTLYALAGTAIGLFLPIAYIFEGILEGDQQGIKAASPHVFLLASQVLLEGVTLSGRVSQPVRVFVPVFYNARRLLSIMEWLGSELSKPELDYGGSERRLKVGRALAAANLAFWGFNLFGVLLPFRLPKAFKIYHSNFKQED